MRPTFDDVLPRLLDAYDRRQLVPFVGAGMSMPACRTWKRLIDRLDPEGTGGSPLDLVRRADDTLTRLHRLAQPPAEAIAAALYDPEHPNEAPGLEALVDVWWPLMVTTNYDHLLAEAFLDRHDRSHLEVLGRSEADCHRVLHSRDHVSNPILWAIQGFLTRCVDGLDGVFAGADLEAEIVLSHAQYRRVTHKAPHFRRAFSSVFRDRSFLFLGCSLGDHYLLDLFGEVLEMTGRTPTPHVALMPEGRVDPAFMRRRFDIEVVEYSTDDDHRELRERLSQLASAVAEPRPRPVRWSFGFQQGPRADEEPVVGLDIVRGLTPAPSSGSWTVVSGIRRDGQVFAGDKVAEALGLSPEPFVALEPECPVYRHPRAERVFALAGETPVGIYEATRRLLDRARHDGGVERVCFQLLHVSPGRRIPASVSLLQMVRAVAGLVGVPHAPRVEIRAYTPEITGELEMGRLKIEEVLRCQDLRLAVEIVDRFEPPDTYYERRQPATTLRELAAIHHVPPSWQVEIVPVAEWGDAPRALASVEGGWTLEECGVVPGGVVRFRA